MYAKILIAYVFLCGISGYKFTCNSIPRLYQTPLQQRCLQTVLAYYHAHQVTNFQWMLTEHRGLTKPSQREGCFIHSFAKRRLGLFFIKMNYKLMNNTIKHPSLWEGLVRLSLPSPHGTTYSRNHRSGVSDQGDPCWYR